MNHPLFIGSARGTHERISEACGTQVMAVALADIHGAESLARLMAARPSVVFVEIVGNPATAFALTSAVAQHYGAPVVIVAERAEELGLSALRSGARDIISPSAGIEDFRNVLGLIDRMPGNPVAPTLQGRIITVASPKGGVGKTTVASNLAVALAMQEPESTVIVDLDLQFGDVGSALNLTPEYSVVEAVAAANSGDALATKSLLARHSTGLYAVVGAETPAAVDGISSSDVAALLSILKASFKYVVVDTAPGMTDHTLSAFDLTDDLVLVTSLDVPGVRGLRIELNTLKQLGLMFDGRHLVLNFNDPKRGLTVGDVEATVGVKVDVAIPQSAAVPLSVNQGIPLLQSGSKDPAARQLRMVVERVTGAILEAPVRRGLLSRRG